MVLGFSQDGACTDLLENLSVNSLKRDLSNALTFNPPLFSLVNTFKKLMVPGTYLKAGTILDLDPKNFYAVNN